METWPTRDLGTRTRRGRPAPRPLLAAALAGLGAFLALAVPVRLRWPPLVALDASVSAWAADVGRANPGWVGFWRVVTHGGDGAFVGVVAGVAALVFLVRRDYPRLAFVAAASLGSTAILTVGRAATMRVRPADGFVVIGGYGYPSGHTIHATTLAVAALVLLWPLLGRARRAAAVGLGAVFAGAVGASRVTLLAHWPSDVVGGWLAGTGLVLLLAWFLRGNRTRPRTDQRA